MVDGSLFQLFLFSEGADTDADDPFAAIDVSFLNG